METRFSMELLNYTRISISPSIYHFKFGKESLTKQIFLPLSNKKIRKFSVNLFSSSNSLSYGGWDDLDSNRSSDQSSKSKGFRNFLASLGFDDKKYVILFILGFSFALVISRVKISSTSVFPSSLLIFISGLSLGIYHGFGSKESSRNQRRMLGKEADNFRVASEKLKNVMVDLLRELDKNISDVKGVMDGIDSNFHYEHHNEKNCIQSIKTSILIVSNVSDLMKSFVNADYKTFYESQLFSTNGYADASHKSINSGNEILSRDKNLNQKVRKKEAGIDFVRFFNGLVGENPVGLRSKAEDSEKQEIKSGTNLNSHKISMNTRDETPEDQFVDISTSLGDHASIANRWDASRIVENNTSVNNGKWKDLPQNQRYCDSELSYHENNCDERSIEGRSMGNQYENMNNPNRIVTHESQSSISNPVNFSSGRSYVRDFSSLQSQSNERHHRANFSNLNKQDEDWVLGNQRHRFHTKEIGAEPKREDEDRLLNRGRSSYEDSSSLTSIGEDEEFSKNLSEATDLIKLAKQSLTSEEDEEKAEIMLYKSASALTRALTVRPTSLLAIGQLGNTFLLHGELKLKISRELRYLLSKSDSFEKEPLNVGIERTESRALSKNKISSVLIDVCEECEQFLVEAGRKYRMALSIDSGDVRALYNWGLALFFRAQLIADIGPEAATDADRIYLAAIDKFDAMLSRSNAHAPDALFRWGLILQQRSRLRPSNSKEKIKLLNQARRLLEDALLIDSSNMQAKKALSSCLSELHGDL